MKSNCVPYDFEKSLDRMDAILKTDYESYKELDSIPSRDSLTYTNGFYVLCTALFVDLRIPGKLSERYRKTTLAKIYRSYTSEIVAIINGNCHCAEINIEGNTIWGIFNTPYRKDVDTVLSTAAKISSIVDILNSRCSERNIEPITIGIGLDYGRALMMRAGYDSSNIDDVVWLGEVIDSASRLCTYGNKRLNDKEIMVSNVCYNNLNNDNKKMLAWNKKHHCYHGDIMNVYMSERIREATGLLLH